MSLIVLIGAQAVGKMAIGRQMAGKLDAKLLYNHQTIDFFAQYLGYGREAFRLSDETRRELFRAFVNNRGKNPIESIIFTVLIDFGDRADLAFLKDISKIFLKGMEEVYFIELTASLAERLHRNKTSERLQYKPVKRDIASSDRQLIEWNKKLQLESRGKQLAETFPKVHTWKLDTTLLTVTESAQMIIEHFHLK
ncbi:MAG: cytidylate kinase family protein [Enterococcaceae bacterium]|jgi:ATP-dependent protease HslVU (ClpYQ) ATPase subunit|nr:cytidylate kinase family protein [Enterococcaceae bacterium]MCI1918946.1 cytidylate kinase family protein [Enterococcaceae bacterium]